MVTIAKDCFTSSQQAYRQVFNVKRKLISVLVPTSEPIMCIMDMTYELIWNALTDIYL